MLGCHRVLAEVQTFLSGAATAKGPAAEPAILASIAAVSPSTKQIYDAQQGTVAASTATIGSPGSDVADSELLGWLARVAVSNELFKLAEVLLSCVGGQFSRGPHCDCDA